MRHTHNSNDLLSCLTDGAHAEILRRLCANQGAIAPLRMEYDTTSRPAGPGRWKIGLRPGGVTAVA